MNKKIVYWKWKTTIIDFDAISNETIDYDEYITKKDYIFHYLGTPDRKIHEWYGGGYSSEYNSALSYARQLGLVENYVDYENEIYELKKQVKKQKEAIDKINKFCKEDKNFEILDLYSQDKVDEIQVQLLDILKEVSE